MTETRHVPTGVQIPDEENPAKAKGQPGDWRDEKLGVKEKLLAAACWATGSAWLVPSTTFMTLAHYTVGAKAIDPFSRFFCRAMVASATWSKWEAHVHPEIREDEQYVFAQNHINHFDFVSMYPATKHFKQGIELESHFKYPVYGWFMKSRGTIPVPADRDKRLQAVEDGMRKEVEAGRSVLAFPEGTRTLSGRVGPFRSGIFVAARNLGLKVVPTAVTGMYDAMRKGSLAIRPFQKIEVWLEKPVDFAGVSDADLPAKIDEVRDAIVARVDDYLDRQANQKAR